MHLTPTTDGVRRRQSRGLSRRARLGNGVKNGTQGLRTAATVVPGRVWTFFADLGPGLITGAADDDPSGISTYSVTGAAFGYAPLWTAIFSFPLMVVGAAHVRAARHGDRSRARGRGPAPLPALGAVVGVRAARRRQRRQHRRRPRRHGRGDRDGDGHRLAPARAALRRAHRVAALLVVVSPHRAHLQMAHAGALRLRRRGVPRASRLARDPARDARAAHRAGRPRTSRRSSASSARRSRPTSSSGRRDRRSRRSARADARPSREREGATDAELRRSYSTSSTGMFFSNFVMYFIILTTAATLHAHGVTRITTAQQAAEALRPLAGDGAYWLFTLGLIGTGMLGVPVLAGSSAYAIAEAAAWRGSLDNSRSRRAASTPSSRLR